MTVEHRSRSVYCCARTCCLVCAITMDETSRISPMAAMYTAGSVAEVTGVRQGLCCNALPRRKGVVWYVMKDGAESWEPPRQGCSVLLTSRVRASCVALPAARTACAGHGGHCASTAAPCVAGSMSRDCHNAAATATATSHMLRFRNQPYSRSLGSGFFGTGRGVLLRLVGSASASARNSRYSGSAPSPKLSLSWVESNSKRPSSFIKNKITL